MSDVQGFPEEIRESLSTWKFAVVCSFISTFRGEYTGGLQTDLSLNTQKDMQSLYLS